MNNFSFFNPVQIHFGKQQIAKLAQIIPPHARVLLTYGGGFIKNNGIYEQVTNALAHHEIYEFGGIESNPQYDTLIKARDLAREKEITFLLAVGGGSVIDGTKFIAASIKQPNDPWDILAKNEKINSVVPFGSVLTLPATGSEMNSFSVITRGEEKLGFGGDPRLFPKFSILDPEVTYSLPEKQLGNGIVDAFIHVLEQYLTNDINTPLQDRFAEGILLTLIDEAPKVIELKDDYDSRANFMWAATNALNGLIGAGTVHDWATHMIGHELTALHGIDHARTLALVLPSLLRFQKDHKNQKLLQYAHNVWGIKASTPEETIENAITATEDFFNSVGVPTRLKAYNIGEAEIEKIVAAVSKHHPYGLSEHRNLKSQEIQSILKAAI
ncbi:MAG: NADH-dependent alcohol dehydrogenase [Halobacteriovoraceae bacterium]|nr:NADH-dependent alcohol dehydrogenase [Halobacteriovoraceae bacterium]|tara:strand:+ start:14129 stop:15280 length:1152 start_codon:yes stop_codon:yes gene_type:complete